ncbi:PQQ-dependent sugar dehydrogenase [Weeksellaceae bacterium KMM 9713]|uniref:PQQ-dependent sugar dehydrogenase n=1 Tax=Profundicola chukchiensis TaxID=2961959 RepID=A0A9X4MWH7_9FLAO|nr:PQQ-dependent sugar dehydrogenase [Profundicola chukchiensis]MDG4945363.1 PQQ-dependent sugar dehydrogenase [Profundicola chukchiensis]
MKSILYIFILLFCSISCSQEVELELLASGLSFPVNITHAGDERLFICEQAGKIKIYNADGQMESQVFLDISSLTQAQGERGLLGLAFSPNYNENGQFYVNYTNLQGNTTIARYTVSDNPNIANPTGEVILTIDQPYSNHNGGNMHFGPDGYLYIATGDGGSGGDPQNNAQNKNSLLGKILRIDVNAAIYTIPEDNPFVGDEGLDEIWAYGVRNPWKFSFDSTTNEIWIADVGQYEIEEINRQASDASGLNYGWRCYEGNNVYNLSQCASADSMIFPVATYSHSNGRCSITGGHVYRGEDYPALQGKYFFADYCSQEIGVINQDNTLEWLTGTASANFTAFGEDANKELYAVGSGKLYRIKGSNLNIFETKQKNVKITPNPASDFVQIDGFEHIKKVSIYDAQGRFLKSIQRFNDNKINIKDLLTGVYLIQIEADKLSYSFKMIKK